MLLSAKHSKLYDYLDIAFYPPQTGPLSSLDWMSIIRLGYSKLLSPSELAHEYHACLRKISEFCKQGNVSENLQNLKALMSVDTATFSSIARMNSLPNDIFIAYLITVALEQSVSPDSLKTSLKRILDKAFSSTLSEKAFLDSAIASIHQSKILAKMQKRSLAEVPSKKLSQIAPPLHFAYTSQATQNQDQKLHDLLKAISTGNISVAINLVIELSPMALNQRNKTTGATALQYALAYQHNEIGIAIIEKLIAAGQPLDVPDEKGLTPFHYNAELILETISKIYCEYACSDYLRFEHVIAPEKKNWVIAKSQAVTEIRSQYEMIANMSAHPNIHTHQFSKEQIQQIANDIDKAKSACCTTFAISLAQKFLSLTTSLNFKIVTHPNGMNSHCYISLTTPTDAVFLLDPWLASLGWGHGVYSKQAYPWPAALASTEVIFDSEKAKTYSVAI